MFWAWLAWTGCGIPMLVAGLWDAWEEIMRHNIEAMKGRGVKTVVTSCPACWLVWHTFYPEWAKKSGMEYPFEAKHYFMPYMEAYLKNGTDAS